MSSPKNTVKRFLPITRGPTEKKSQQILVARRYLTMHQTLGLSASWTKVRVRARVTRPLAR